MAKIGLHQSNNGTGKRAHPMSGKMGNGPKKKGKRLSNFFNNVFETKLKLFPNMIFFFIF